MNPLLLSGLLTGGSGLLSRLLQKKAGKFSYPGMQEDLLLAGKARGKIGTAIEGTRPLSDATTQSYLDRITGREFDAAEGRADEGRAALGMGGSSGDLERQALLTRARGDAMGSNVLQAQDAGLRSRLATVRMMQGLTEVGPRIGAGQLAKDQIAAGENADMAGALGGAAGLVSGGLMGDDDLGGNPDALWLRRLLRRKQAASGGVTLGSDFLDMG